MVNLNTFLKEYGVWIALALVVVIIIAILVICLSYRHKKQNKNQQEYDEFVLALGGLENILSVSFKGSRLSLVLNDYALIEEKKLETLGVSSFIKMSNKITLVTATAEEISSYLEKSINH